MSPRGITLLPGQALTPALPMQCTPGSRPLHAAQERVGRVWRAHGQRAWHCSHFCKKLVLSYWSRRCHPVTCTGSRVCVFCFLPGRVFLQHCVCRLRGTGGEFSPPRPLVCLLHRHVRQKVQLAIAQAFGISASSLYLTKPTFFSRINSTEARTAHDEYWRAHVDKVGTAPPTRPSGHPAPAELGSGAVSLCSAASCLCALGVFLGGIQGAP